MKELKFKLMGCWRKLMLSMFLILFFSVQNQAQELEFVDLGVIEGEFRQFRRTLSWVNNGEKSVRLKLWSDNADLKFTSLADTVGTGEQVDIQVKIDLPREAGDYEYELRLLDENDFVLYGYQMSFKVLQSELDVFKAYRNVYWPFRTKEEVFSLKAGQIGDTLSAIFDVYNLGGKDLSLENVDVSDSVMIDFLPNEIGHNKFGRMKIEFLSNQSSRLGFQRQIIELHQNGRLLAALPVQYTLIPNLSSNEGGAKITTSIVNHDFKVVKVGDKKEVTVSIANNGSEKLDITRMESNCDCLIYNEIQSISPGTSQNLRVIFDAKGRLGLERKTIAIFTNDPNKPVQVLTFRAHVK